MQKKIQPGCTCEARWNDASNDTGFVFCLHQPNVLCRLWLALACKRSRRPCHPPAACSCAARKQRCCTTLRRACSPSPTTARSLAPLSLNRRQASPPQTPTGTRFSIITTKASDTLLCAQPPRHAFVSAQRLCNRLIERSDRCVSIAANQIAKPLVNLFAAWGTSTPHSGGRGMACWAAGRNCRAVREAMLIAAHGCP